MNELPPSQIHGRIHPVLAAAIKSARAAHRPPPPWHLGGPPPVLSSVDLVRIALLCAERAADRAPEDERLALAPLLSNLREALAAGRPPISHWGTFRPASGVACAGNPCLRNESASFCALALSANTPTLT